MNAVALKIQRTGDTLMASETPDGLVHVAKNGPDAPVCWTPQSPDGVQVAKAISCGDCHEYRPKWSVALTAAITR